MRVNWTNLVPRYSGGTLTANSYPRAEIARPWQYQPTVFHLFASIIACFLFSSPLVSQYTTASLAGTIFDPTGAVLPGATVIIQNTGTGTKRAATTVENGSYLFLGLPVGTYRLTVNKLGFSTYTQQGITLDVNQAAAQSVTLWVGAVRDQVTVSSNATLLPTQSSTASQLVDQQRIGELPLNGRLAPTLLFLTPGTINATSRFCALQDDQRTAD